MLKNRGIAFKLVFFIILSGMLIFILIFGYDYIFSKKIILKNVEERAKNLAFATVNRIEAVLRSMEKVPENMTYFLEYASYDKETLLKVLHLVVENNPEIYGSAIAFEPYAFSEDLLYFSPYFYKNGEKIIYKDLGKTSYRYFNWDWYKIPMQGNRSVWSEPYYDKGGANIVMSTYSVPFYKKGDRKRKFIGVMTVDISLKWLHELVSSIKIFKTGYCFLISKKGTIITHPDRALIMKQNIFGIAHATMDKHIEQIGKKMIEGGSGFVRLNDFYTGKESWMFYTPLSTQGWSLGVIFPHDELMEDINRLGHIELILAIGGFLFLFIMVLIIARSITRSLSRLAKATEQIATGNLDTEIPPAGSGDETGKLTESFNTMRRSLKEHIRELTEITAEKQRIKSELNIAHDIQMSFIPKTFPPFPERTEFDIYAVYKSAREVGGDFYDYFFVDDEHLFFAIGDVSDKGVPAALFMAATITLLKVNAIKEIAPDRVLAKVNQKLSRENDSSMFVTIFCGVLNTKTGEVLYANAGHNPPLLLCKGKDAAFVGDTMGVIAGVLEDAEFEMKSVMLHPGDILLTYTDGVTEAMDKDTHLFLSERLQREVNTSREKTMKDMVHGIMDKVRDFSDGAPQSDDITILALLYRGRY